MYKHYESNAVYFSWFSMYLVYQVPEYGVIAPQRDGILINYAIVYAVCICWFNKKK